MTSPWRYKKKVKIYKYRALGDNERHVIDYGTGMHSEFSDSKLPTYVRSTLP